MKINFLFVLAFFCGSLNFVCKGAAQNEPISKTAELQNECHSALNKFLLNIGKYFKTKTENDFVLSLNPLENLIIKCDELNKLLNIKLSSNKVEKKPNAQADLLKVIHECDKELFPILIQFKNEFTSRGAL